jgi:hypothetical protein
VNGTGSGMEAVDGIAAGLPISAGDFSRYETPGTVAYPCGNPRRRSNSVPVPAIEGLVAVHPEPRHLPTSRCQASTLKTRSNGHGPGIEDAMVVAAFGVAFATGFSRERSGGVARGPRKRRGWRARPLLVVDLVIEGEQGCWKCYR